MVSAFDFREIFGNQIAVTVGILPVGNYGFGKYMLYLVSFQKIPGVVTFNIQKPVCPAFYCSFSNGWTCIKSICSKNGAAYVDTFCLN